MPHGIADMLNCLAQVLMDNRPEEIAKHFSFPLPLFHREELAVFGSADTLAEGLAMWRDVLIGADVARMVPRVVAEGLPVNGYMNVWVEWDYLDADGAILRVSQVRYVAFQVPGMMFPKIELVDYTAPAFPEVAADLPLAKSA